jgi:hypothetical protein
MSVEEALDLCDSILGDIPLLPAKAAAFASSVEENVEGIKATIERLGYVTERQEQALNNMADGVRKWL